MNGKVNIGTSGWHYKHWVGDFYPPKFPAAEMLKWYSDRFATVEINNSFYRLPTEEALQHWYEITPKNFCFSVKASRFITHIKRLRDPENAIENFLSRVSVLREKLGPILFQLPPHWHVDEERLELFLNALPKKYRYAVEFRDLTWYVPNIYAVLQRHNTALCIHDWRAAQWPIEFTADFTYVRFHGPSGTYNGNYSDSMLRKWATQVRQWKSQLSKLYLYFNNDQGGHAIRNAQQLLGYLKENTGQIAA